MDFIYLITAFDETLLITARNAGQVVRFDGVDHVAVAGQEFRIFGSGDIYLSEGYWDKVGMYQGDYTGEWFSGDSTPISTNVDYRWRGEANASFSDKYLVPETPKPAYYCNIDWFTLDECTTLRSALGDEGEYVSAERSDAPWYSDINPFLTPTTGAQKFLGAYALEVTALSDSKRSAGITEGLLDGGVIGRARRAVPTFRFRVLLTAVDEEGLEYGTSWLDAALAEAICSTHGPSCGSVDLTFLIDCPPAKLPDMTDEEYSRLVDSMTRVYHDVKRIEGPIVTQEIRRKEANMYGRIVEFTLAAGVASMFGVASISQTVPRVGERIIYDIAQNLLPNPSGEIATATNVVVATNHATNPSAEVNATGWAMANAVVSGTSPAAFLTAGRTTELAAVGLASHRVRLLGNNGTTAVTNAESQIYNMQDVSLAGITAGSPMSFSMWGALVLSAGASGSVLHEMRALIEWRDGAGSLRVDDIGSVTTGLGGKVFSASSIVPPAGATIARCIIRARVTWSSSSTAANNSDIRLYADALALTVP